MHLSLTGYMGSGKSTVGKELAAQLNWEFQDLDQFIENQKQKTIAEIFSQEGEIKFRKYEREALIELLESDNDSVISLGGGTPAYYDNMHLVNENSYSVYLRLTPKELIKRLENQKSVRPLLSHLSDDELPEFIAKHLFERRNYYEQAQFTLDVKEKSPHEIAREIILRLPPHRK